MKDGFKKSGYYGKGSDYDYLRIMELRHMVGSRYVSISEDRDSSDMIIRVSSDGMTRVLHVLQNYSMYLFKSIIDIVCIDIGEGRYKLVYVLVSVMYSRRVRVEVIIGGDDDDGDGPSSDGMMAVANCPASVESIKRVYAGGDWLEREVYDMFGVRFEGHGDMRRLLTDYGFEGHPLRKDFPVTGYREVRYDEGRKGVVSESIEVTQER